MSIKQPGLKLSALCAISLFAFAVHAAPPEGKGPGQNPANANSGGNAAPNKGGPGTRGQQGAPHKKNEPGYKSLSTHGGAGPEDAGHGQKVLRAGGVSQDDRRYDNRGRYYDYFDDRRDRHGRYDYDGLYNDLAYAGITAAVARELVRDYGLGGYSPLPPGIRKNLARGQPLPPGIAKKISSHRLVGRLP